MQLSGTAAPQVVPQADRPVVREAPPRREPDPVDVELGGGLRAQSTDLNGPLVLIDGPSKPWIEPGLKGSAKLMATVPADDGGASWSVFEITFDGPPPTIGGGFGGGLALTAPIVQHQRPVASTDGGPPWTEVQTRGPYTTTYRVRQVDADDGGAPWVERQMDGNSMKTRTAPASDDGPAWNEVLSNGQLTRNRLNADGWFESQTGDGRVGRNRMASAEDGGPQWMESSTGDGPVTRTRFIPATEGEYGWNEVQVGEGPLQRTPFGTRQVTASDGGDPWTERMVRGAPVRSRPAGDWEEFAVEGRASFKTRRVPIENGRPIVEYEIDGQVVREGTVPAADGRGDWRLSRSGGDSTMSRRYVEDGTSWTEAICGDNRWRVRDGVEEAALAGDASTLWIGTTSIQVYGAATPAQLANLQKALDDAPAPTLQHARTIILSERLGQAMDRDGNPISADLDGLGGNGKCFVNPSCLSSLQQAKHVLYHEMGHVADFAGGRVSSAPLWGSGSSVSFYGKSNALEDFAETHRVVVTDWDRLSTLSAEEWKQETFADKKQAILGLYHAPRDI